MNTRKQESFEELKNFLQTHKLVNNHANANFYANVSIRTENEYEKRKMPVIVDFNTSGKLGKVTIEDYDLNPYLYPITFFPDYDIFTHVEKLYLKIEGTHANNPKIGKYIIEIYPLERI